jgi:hypothetical protein
MVAFSYEMIHDTRVIYTDGRPHVGDGIRQYLGDSRARWEGDELVVVTTNLTDKTSIGGNGNGLRHSDKMSSPSASKRVGRRRTAVSVHGGRPVTYVRPFTMSMPLTPLDGGVLLPTSVTRATAVCRTRSALSARKTKPSRKTQERIVRARRAIRCRCRTVLPRPPKRIIITKLVDPAKEALPYRLGFGGHAHSPFMTIEQAGSLSETLIGGDT